MPAHFRFDRPDLDHWKAGPPLFVTGVLAGALPLVPYEGRLQIHNGIGECTARLLDGELPPGWAVFVDQATKQVIVGWPAYSSTVIPLANTTFDDGTIDGWNITQTGGIGNPHATTWRPYAGPYSAFWEGGQGTGHARGVEAVWENLVRPKVLPGQVITASAMIGLDDTNRTQNRGEIRLNYYDVSGALIGFRPGNLIRGNRAAYRLSTVTAAAPAGSDSVAVALWTTANQYGGVLFDAVSWNFPAILGTNEDRDWGPLVIEVRDQAGRTALWRGTIGEPWVYYTSLIYPVVVTESIAGYGQVDSGFIMGQPFDELSAAGSLQGVVLQSTVEYLTIPSGPDSMGGQGRLQSATLESAVQYLTYNIPPEAMQGRGSITGVQLVVTTTYLTYNNAPESFSGSGKLQGVTLT